MSLWHIPVHKYFDTDPFLDDIMEITFPPLRYFPLFNVGTNAVSKKTPKENGFVVNLDVKHYKPEEVTLKVEERVENGFESSEFHRKYTIPDDVDATALTSNISQGGVLHIEAPKKLPASSGESTKETFKFSLDVQGFKPEEISIQVKGRDLIVHGETKTENSGEHGSSYHHKQFTKHVALPDDVDPSELCSRYTKDSKLTIEAPRKQLQAPLKLEIKMEE
ncbi:heat shock protein Hsp-16.48/Hsp-16.49-like [Hydra vulgaris]|uniref:heat shock protein Hsp-16.48/Hsp-16.49-like n=1 Tax=Hydra vulgaris TaxID=6087 RepID=UPI0032EA7434